MKLYNDYRSYLENRHGCRVYRIGLDAGFSCPNRDGLKGTGGCIYCNASGSRSSYVNPEDPVSKQLAARIKHLKENKRAAKFIAYFQAFTNTYAPVESLKKIYDEVLPFDEVVGISIGTRPDAVDRDKLKLISSYMPSREIWIEYGLQSSHDRTLKTINRGHDFKTFANAVNTTKDYGIKICAHIILGLPGEKKNDMIETIEKLNRLKIDGIKMHLLHVLKDSPLEKLYNDGKVSLLEQIDYVRLVCDMLENLSEDIVIQRMTGEGARQTHIAPLWALDKIGTIQKIEEELKRRNSRQGIKCGCRL